MNKTGMGRLSRWGGALLISAALVVSLRNIAGDVAFRLPLLKQAFVADAGWTESVPPEVVDARLLLAAHNADGTPVALGPGLQDDSLLQQRMWEGLYPARLHEAETGRMLWKAPGPERPGCTVIARSERVVLADCH